MSLRLQQGDTGTFVATVTRPAPLGTLGPASSPLAQDLTGCTIYLTCTNAAGAAVISHSTLDGGVVIQTPASGGIAIWTLQPSDTSGFTQPQTMLTYRLVLVDSLARRSTLEVGTLLVTQ